MLNIILIFSLLSCEKENTITPNDLLQGKWKIILMGNEGDLRPYETQWIYEYYNDSLMREYDTAINEYTFHAKYTIDQDFLIHYYIYPKDTLIFKYKYELFDDNRMLKRVCENFITNLDTDVLERID